MAFYVHHFTVEGHGVFPFDMLRYDSCYPARQDDTVLISSRPINEFALKTRRVRLNSRQPLKSWKPETGRWESFGWRVVEQGSVDRLDR